MTITSNTRRSLAIALSGLLWLYACLASWRIVSSGFVQLMLYVWTVTIFFLPLVFAVSGARLRPVEVVPRSPNCASLFVVRALIASSIVGCFLVVYAMCVTVLERVHALWWEHVKFGGDSISLGEAAAELFASTALAVVLLSLGLYRLASLGHRLRAIARASVALVAVATLIYLVLGIGPHAEWRA